MTEPNSRKRKRKSEQKTACFNCKTKHVKCSGGNPCKQCDKANVQCIYKPKKKRGPRKGYRQEYNDKIVELQHIIEQQKAELLALRATCTRQQQQMYSNSLANTSVDTQMSNNAFVFRYVNVMYASEVAAIHVKPPRHGCITRASPHAYQVFADAAMGAFLEGNTHYEDQFRDRAKKLYSELGTQHVFDIPVTTSADITLGALALYTCRLEESQSYMMRANAAASQYLMKKPEGLSARERTIRRTLMLYRLKIAPKETKHQLGHSILAGIFRECDGDVSELGTTDRSILAIVLTLKIIHTLRELRAVGRTLAINEQSLLYMTLMQATEAARYPIAGLVPVLIHISRANINLAIGDKQRAFKHASYALSTFLAANPMSSPVSTMALRYLFELFADIGSAEKFMVCIDLLRDLSKRWKLARMMSDIVFAMISRGPLDPIVQAYKRNSNLVDIMNAHSMATMLQKLQAQGCNLTASEPLLSMRDNVTQSPSFDDDDITPTRQSPAPGEQQLLPPQSFSASEVILPRPEVPAGSQNLLPILPAKEQMSPAVIYSPNTTSTDDTSPSDGLGKQEEQPLTLLNSNDYTLSNLFLSHDNNSSPVPAEWDEQQGVPLPDLGLSDAGFLSEDFAAS